MAKVIDLYLDLPATEEYLVGSLSWYCMGEGAESYKGYKYTFGEKQARSIGLSMAELDEILAEEGPDAFTTRVRNAAREHVVPLDDFIRHLDSVGVAWGITSTHDHNNEKTAEIVARYPDKLLGFAYLDPKQPMQAVRNLEYAVRELKLSAAYLTAFRTGVAANDPRCYPIYAKAVELEIPVFIYSCMNLSAGLPMDIGHPRYVDQVARDFPELKIMATVGGWPWVPEMVGVVRRHPNVYLNAEVHEPANLGIPGSGFETLMHYGKSALADRFCFASNWQLQCTPIEDLIQQMKDLPLPDAVIEKWLYTNAARFFAKD
jgi:uncharacterized protein